MGRRTEAADRAVKDIRRQTRKRYSSEGKIRIVLAGLRGEDREITKCRGIAMDHGEQLRPKRKRSGSYVEPNRVLQLGKSVSD